jgi:hypothetical protein
MWVYGGMTDLQERADFWRWDSGEMNIYILKVSLYHAMKVYRGHAIQAACLTFTLLNRKMVDLMPWVNFHQIKYPVSFSAGSEEDSRMLLGMCRPISLLSYLYSCTYCLSDYDSLLSFS